MEDNEKRTENARERTVYIDGRPVREIGNAEVEPTETKPEDIRVRKKYKNRLLKEVRAKMKEADE